MNSQLMATKPTQRMSLNGDPILDDRDYQSDDESLFGSPPPSPNTGKAFSPALPGEGLASEQNVGTLALPGSHNPSKLPVDSVVYLLDARHHPLETRSSRTSTPARTATSRATPLAVTTSDPPPRSSQSTTDGVSKKRKRTKKPSKTTATSGPSIQLPPSDAPVPPNFLRNQQALLGIAGLVANINPASLSARRHHQGGNPTNPIVVEDEGATLPLSEQPAAPTPAQLLATLSAQKELFPVLEQLLGILRRGIDPPAQPPFNSGQQPSKRRRLSRVPAGAADWDVPFPFPPGEGPPNYQEEWTNERCERLISDFIALLREGTNKAAARVSTKRASSQPAPQSSVQPRPTSPRRSLPPTNDNLRSPSSSYVPLPLDVYLRPTVPHGYATLPPTPATTQPPESDVDLLAAAFGLVSSHDGDLPNSDAFGLSMDPLSPGFDLDPLLLTLMGTGPSQEEPSGVGSPAPSSEEASTPALSYSPYHSQSITSGPSPMTPNFDPSMVSQQDRGVAFGSTPHPEPQGGAYFSQGESLYEDLMRRGLFTGLELGMDVGGDLGGMFGIEGEVPCELSVANRQPHLCDPPSAVLPTFPGLELLPQGPGIVDQGALSVNTSAPSNTPMALSTISRGASDIPSSSNTKPPTFEAASLQRQRPVPKRSTPPMPASKGKGAAKKRREEAIQQGKDLRRELSAEVGKSKVRLWELTMEQGVLTRMSKDERLTRT